MVIFLLRKYPNLNELDILFASNKQIKFWLDQIKRDAFEAYYPHAAIQYELLSFRASFSKGSQLPKFEDLFPDYARLETRKPPPYTPNMVSCFEHLLKKGMVGNGLLTALKTDKLKESGWSPKKELNLPKESSDKKNRWNRK